MTKLLRVLAALVVGVSATLVFATPAQATTATFTQTVVWSTGYAAEVTVTNDFSVPITGWEVAFTLPAGSTVSNPWSTQIAQTTPHHIMINDNWNGELDPGESVTFGFIVEGGTGTPTFLWPT